MVTCAKSCNRFNYIKLYRIINSAIISIRRFSFWSSISPERVSYTWASNPRLCHDTFYTLRAGNMSTAPHLYTSQRTNIVCYFSLHQAPMHHHPCHHLITITIINQSINPTSPRLINV